MSFPTRYAPGLFRGQLYFTPSDGGPRKLLMDNGESKDPRLIFPPGRGLLLQDLKESDSGTYSGFDVRTENEDTIIILRVLDCSEKKIKTFGETYTLDVSRRVEYLEFTPLHTNQTTVLWNRSNSEASKRGRGGMTSRGWEIICLAPADSGHYNFRKKDNSLLSRIRLTVEESLKDYDAKVNERFLIEDSCFRGVSWTVTFTMRGTQGGETLIKAGEVVAKNDWVTTSFTSRIWVLNNGIELVPVRVTDVGTYKFSDPQGNLAHVAMLTVHPEFTPPYVPIAIAGGIVLAVIVCSCCVWKCCCKKGSPKRDESVPVAVYYHDPDQPAVNPPASSQPAATSIGLSDQDLPAGQSYSATPPPDYSYQPVNPPTSIQPAATSVWPSVSAPGGQGATPAPSLGSDCLTSDPDTKFELKGLTLPSAPPLGSDSGVSDVYTSDKLNFL
ncbi:uncharacterized protein LOC115568766 isoform X2 [Sparus aurata]|nr:uncharacterized protein LOC115568766 isoform X2 [Sparus aurata]